MNVEAAQETIQGFKTQAAACRTGGSPFSAAVIEAMAMDFAKQGPVFDMAKSWYRDGQEEGHVVKNAMVLRLLGGLHRLVLDETADALAQHYPSVGGTPGPTLIPDMIEAVSTHSDFLQGYMDLPPQTNEVGRSHALLGGFLAVAKKTDLPLRLLEIGSSAGLNLFWDQFSYANQTFQWGHSKSEVCLETEWSGPALTPSKPPSIVDRVGCDIAPVDVHDHEACRRLESYVWADQPERLNRLRGAIKIARQADYRLDQADAGVWLEEELAAPTQGTCTVIFHSIMWQYMPPETQDRAATAIQSAGSTATHETPVAWLRLELDEPTQFPVLRLTTWPDGTESILATAHFHGAWVKWGNSDPGYWA